MTRNIHPLPGGKVAPPNADALQGATPKRRSIKELYGCLEGLRSGPPLTIEDMNAATADGAVDEYLASVS